MDRQQTIEAIVDAARRPQPPIVEIRELLGSDGKWRRGNGFPYGVHHTGEVRLVGYAFTFNGGCPGGNVEPTRDALIARHIRLEDANAADFRSRLEEMDDERIASQAAYWLKTK